MSFLEKMLASVMAYRELAINTADELQGKIEETTKRVLKSSALFVMAAFATILILVGLSGVLESVFGWVNGMGLMVVGASLLVLALIVKALK